MDKMRTSLHSKVHDWMKKVGFRKNSSKRIKKDNLTVNHYFFKTFNCMEHRKVNAADTAKFICFDVYGEKLNVRSLLDLQSAFYENLSQLR